MKGLFYFFGLAVLALGQQAAIAELQESNTVPSEQLMTDFSLVKTSGESDVAVLASLFKAPLDKNQGPTLLRISDNDALVFSVGDASVSCKQDQSCRLPFVKGAAYKAEVRRFNGETFQTQVELPQETSITSPAENSVFSKQEDIQVNWTASFSPTHGITLSTFLADLHCSTTGWVKWDEPTTAVIPAGYVGTCPDLVKARFTTFYVNVAGMPGIAGGTLKGYSMANLHFSFADQIGGALTLTPTPTLQPAMQPLSHGELAQILRQTEASPTFGQTLLR